MADDPAATPTDSSPAKQVASKDKQCPFCRQAFSSSSLGRHLDLYIKEKNPKPPDNIHDVEEIKKIRGNITRRRPKKESSASSSAKATPSRDQPSPTVQKTYPNALNAEDGSVRTFWNQPNWQATGVINDLPPLSEDDPGSIPSRRTPSRSASVKEDVNRRQRATDQRDQGQAAELALKEVLENVRSANARAHPVSPFDFNFFKLSLPQMYLKLSPPPELLSQAPVLGQMTWSIDPPGTQDFEILRGWLQDRLHDWRRLRETLRFGNDVLRNGVNGNSSIHAEDDIVNNEESLYNEHLSKAHQQWVELSDAERREKWHFECTKALAREREHHSATTQKLEQAEQENSLLRNRLARSNVALDPKELYREPPSVLPLSEQSLSFLPNAASWDFDALLGKWKSRIRSARSTQYPLPSSSAIASRADVGEFSSSRTHGFQRAISESQHGHQESDSMVDQAEDDIEEEDEDNEAVEAEADVTSPDRGTGKPGTTGRPQSHSEQKIAARDDDEATAMEVEKT